MQETASRSEIEGLVESFLGGEVEAPANTGGPFGDPGTRIWRMRALLLLAAYHFPIERMSVILRCSAADVNVALDVVRRRLPDPASILRFLDGDHGSDGSGPAGVAVSASAEEALETLHYWTDKWFDDDNVEIERTHGEPEFSS